MAERILGYFLMAPDHPTRLARERSLSDKEYEEYQRHARRLLTFYRDQGLFLAAVDNYFDLEDEVHRHLVRNIDHYAGFPSVYGIEPPPMAEIEAILNKRIINYLATVRLFLDHADHTLKHRYGEGSPERMRFKEATRRAYDGSFSYRFVYHLRNYVQHQGLPIGDFKIHGALSFTEVGGFKQGFGVYFSRDRLLEEGGALNRKVRDEIAALPPIVDVVPHLKAMLALLGGVNLAFLGTGLAGVELSMQFLQDLFAPVLAQDHAPLIAWLEEEGEGERKRLQVDYPPLFVAKALDRMRALGRDS